MRLCTEKKKTVRRFEVVSGVSEHGFGMIKVFESLTYAVDFISFPFLKAFNDCNHNGRLTIDKLQREKLLLSVAPYSSIVRTIPIVQAVLAGTFCLPRVDGVHCFRSFHFSSHALVDTKG